MARSLYFNGVNMNYNVQSQPWAASSMPTQLMLPTKANWPSFAKWWPANWLWVEFEITKQTKTKSTTKTIGAFVPDIEFEQIRPGVNGVRQLRGELGDVSNRLGQLQRDGWIYLDPKRHDYIRVYPARNGQYHDIKWMEIRVLANRVIKTMDRQSFWRWGVELLINGELGVIEPHFWELHITDYQKRTQRYINQQHIPEQAKKLQQQYDTLDAMRRFVDDYKANGLDVYKAIFEANNQD